MGWASFLAIYRAAVSADGAFGPMEQAGTIARAEHRRDIGIEIARLISALYTEADGGSPQVGERYRTTRLLQRGSEMKVKNKPL